jgi:hypothetical protein
LKEEKKNNPMSHIRGCFVSFFETGPFFNKPYDFTIMDKDFKINLKNMWVISYSLGKDFVDAMRSVSLEYATLN